MSHPSPPPLKPSWPIKTPLLLEFLRHPNLRGLPEGFSAAPMTPEDTAFYSPEQGEFLLPYVAGRTANNPNTLLQAFLQSTYEAAANGAGWQQAALERDSVPPS